MSDPQKQLQKVKSAIAKARAEIGDYRKYVDGMEQQLLDSFAEATRSFGIMLDNELLYDFISEFKKQPFFTIPKSKGEWWLVVPKNVPLEFGFLYAQDGPWNIFIVSKYANLIQDIPEALQEELEFDLTPPFDGITVDEDTGLLHIDRPDHDDVKEVRSRYKKYLGAIKDSSTIRIKKGMLFEMMAALIRDGILPYKARPVPKSLFRDRQPKFELRDYQQRDWDTFLKTGAVGLFYPMGGGKSFLALMAIQRFKGKKLILVPNGTVAENWKEYVLQWTDLPPEQVSTERVDVGKVEVSIIIYNRANVDAVLKVEWSFVDFDETTTVVADTHIAFANVKAMTRIFMTATPMREDNRDMMIWAQTGLIVANITVADLVEAGFLAKPKFVKLKYDGIPSGRKYQDEYRELIVMPSRNDAIVDYVTQKHSEGYKIYVDVKHIKHGRDIRDMLIEQGIKAVFISGRSKTSTRQEVLASFEKDGFVLVSTLIKEGVDLPAMNMIVLAGGGKSGTMVIQTIGRALRPKPGVNEALVVDLKDGGYYTRKHFNQRQGTMEEYYGDLYDPVEVEG